MAIHIQRVDPTTYPCNDNNHPKDVDDLEIKDLDYTVQCQKTNLHRYMDAINYPVVFQYKFNKSEIQDLLDALKVGCITRRPSTQHEEELDAIIERLENVIPDTPHGGWFIRFTSNSPKDGMHNMPYMSARQIIEQISSSHRSYTALRDGDDTLYFVNFDRSWDQNRELRVFIRHGKVTAISQYMWHRPGVFTSMTDNELKLLGICIVNWIETLVPPILQVMEVTDATCDLYWNSGFVPGDIREFKIIEFNSYGYWQASGAALFHWNNDRKIMYGTHEVAGVYFRIHI
jgi:hypothetical protein